MNHDIPIGSRAYACFSRILCQAIEADATRVRITPGAEEGSLYVRFFSGMKNGGACHTVRFPFEALIDRVRILIAGTREGNILLFKLRKANYEVKGDSACPGCQGATVRTVPPLTFVS